MVEDLRWNKKAEEGDGQFAIAVALLAVATAIWDLGNGGTAPMGAVEGLASVVEEGFGRMNESVDGIASSISEVAVQLEEKNKSEEPQ